MPTVLVLAGCSLDQRPWTAFADTGDPHQESPSTARHIEIEVDDLDTGLPCAVIDRPDAGSRNVLWRAEFEADFCRRKAEETRLILQDKGWACRPQTADERQDLVQASVTPPSGTPHLIAAWSCLEGLRPIQSQASLRPPVPSVKPDVHDDRSTAWGDERLRAAVEADLAAIGQQVVEDQTTIDTALGDLNDDGVDDAIVILTRDAVHGRPHRMLMAYLQSADAYNLVDVWILDPPKGPTDAKLVLAIEDGRVRLENCCETAEDPTVLRLADRKLAYAQGG